MIGAGQSSESIHLPWWRSYIVGYIVSPLLVGMMTLARLFVSEPLFVWTPFCLIVVIVAFLWGAGPALLTMTLAILAISYVVIPRYELLTLNIWNDITLLGPFVIVQILIILLAAQNVVSYRRVLAAKQEVQAYAQTLAEINRQLERANRLKDYFFTRAAHELRTPLTTILGEVQLALRRLDKADPGVFQYSTLSVEVPTFPPVEVEQMFSDLGSILKSIRHDYAYFNYISQGDHLVVEGTSHGVTAGGTEWRAGVTHAGQWCDVFEIRDFKIQRLFIYLDPDYAGADTARYPWLRKRE